MISFATTTGGTFAARLAKSSFWLSLSSIMLNVLVLIRSIVLARLLMPEVFGLFTVCTIVMRATDVLSQTGFNTALIYDCNNYEANKGTAFTLTVLRGVLLTVLLFFISGIVAAYYDNQIIKPLLQFISISFVLKSLKNINSVWYEKNLEFKTVAIYEQVSTLLSSVITVAIVYFYRSVWSLAVGLVIGNCVDTLLSYVFFHGKVKLDINANSAISLFRFGKYIAGISIAVFFTTELDNLVVGKLLGMKELGIYGIAYMLANLPSTHITSVVSRIMMPAYTELRDNVENLQKAYLKTLHLISTVSVPAAFGIAILAEEIISVFYGKHWLAAVVPMQLLCIFGGVRSLAATTGPIVNALGRPRVGFYLVLIKLVLISLIIWPLTSRFGLVGASTAVVLPMLMEQVWLLYIINKLINVNKLVIIESIVPALACSIAMCLIVIPFKLYYIDCNVIGLISLIFIGVISYVVFYRIVFRCQFNVIIGKLRYRDEL